MNPAELTAEVVQLREVSRSYAGAAGPLHALDGISLDVAAGEFVAVAGPS